jgi:hypothetical protein
MPGRRGDVDGGGDGEWAMGMGWLRRGAAAAATAAWGRKRIVKMQSSVTKEQSTLHGMAFVLSGTQRDLSQPPEPSKRVKPPQGPHDAHRWVQTSLA